MAPLYPARVADLAALANLAEIIGASLVVGGAVFAVFQIQLLRKQRRDTSSIEMVRAVHTSEFRDSLQVIWSIPDGLSGEEFRARGSEVEKAALHVFSICEMLGLMVHERIVSLRIVDQLLGGFLRDAWRKVAPFAEAERQRLGSPTYAEWMQWLVEQLERHGQPNKKEGAFRLYSDWRP